MPHVLTCRRGHQWPEPPGDVSVTAQLPVCPECGAEVEAPSATPSVSPSQTLTLPDPPPATPLTPRRLVVPGYEILEELGRGGMGVVYKARQTKLQRLVALKMIRAGVQAGSEELLRFRIEAEAVAAVQHPNIVQIYEVGEHDGCPFFSLEYVAGGSLQQRLAAGPVAPPEAAVLIETLARAVHHAHLRGVIHRDLKPANILLRSKSETQNPKSETKTAEPHSDLGFRISYLEPKITDFGLAKRLQGDAGQTGTGAVLGTPSYMAPEQAAGRVKEIGPAVDVYALGAMLYALLTGQPPFRGDSIMATLRQVVDAEPAPPSRVKPHLSRDLEIICLKCLHKTPTARYASAEALADDLRRWQQGEPILARPVGRLERVVKWTRRRPALAALLATAATALLAVAVGSFWYADHERRRADEERALRAVAEREHAQASREKDRARDNFYDAIDAIEDLLDEVNHHRPDDVPALVRLRSDLLMRAERFFERYLHEHSSELDARREAATAQGRIAALEAKRGRHDRALTLAEAALAEAEALLRENAEQSDLWTARASAWAVRGEALTAQGRHAEALHAFDAALVCWGERVERFPQIPPARPVLGADVHYERGLARKVVGVVGASDDFAAARTALHRLLASTHTRRGYRYRLARACAALAAEQAEQGRTGEAATSYDEAVAWWQELVREYPLVVEYPLQLAETYRRRAALPGQAAIADLEKAVALLKGVSGEHVDQPPVRRQRAATWRELSVAYRGASREADADAAQKRAAALAE
jgi:tetratricopeptide (TPR) repeat protein